MKLKRENMKKLLIFVLIATLNLGLACDEIGSGGGTRPMKQLKSGESGGGLETFKNSEGGMIGGGNQRFEHGGVGPTSKQYFETGEGGGLGPRN